MRGNRVKEKLEAGQMATVLSSHSNSGDTIDLCGSLGLDGFWLEGEHGSVTWDQIGDLSRACDLWGMSSIMRIHENEAGRITRVLDRGVNGIVIPHVNTKEEAGRVVQSARFAPQGKRGMFSGRRAYGDPDYFQHANEELLVVILIEEIQAVENLAEILTVDHIDVFFVAPSDLAQTMGYIGRSDHPKVQETIDKALQQITAAGRTAGTLVTDDILERRVNAGARMLFYSMDSWIRDGAKRLQEQVAALS
ncbi:MAG: aldolase/citrate lyase family protein [Chloroflexota bacterium]